MDRVGSAVVHERGGEQGVRAPKHLGRGRKRGGPAGLRDDGCADCNVCICVWYVCKLISVCFPSFPPSPPFHLFPPTPLHSTPSILPFHPYIHRSNLQVIRPSGDTKEERRGREVVRFRSLRPGHVPRPGHIRMRHTTGSKPVTKPRTRM